MERALKGFVNKPDVIETGGGLSTLIFLALGARVLGDVPGDVEKEGAALLALSG